MDDTILVNQCIGCGSIHDAETPNPAFVCPTCEASAAAARWECPECGAHNHGDVCSVCGHGEDEAVYREYIERNW